jgi:hypothetical protein
MMNTNMLTKETFAEQLKSKFRFRKCKNRLCPGKEDVDFRCKCKNSDFYCSQQCYLEDDSAHKCVCAIQLEDVAITSAHFSELQEVYARNGDMDRVTFSFHRGMHMRLVEEQMSFTVENLTSTEHMIGKVVAFVMNVDSSDFVEYPDFAFHCSLAESIAAYSIQNDDDSVWKMFVHLDTEITSVYNDRARTFTLIREFYTVYRAQVALHETDRFLATGRVIEARKKRDELRGLLRDFDLGWMPAYFMIYLYFTEMDLISISRRRTQHCKITKVLGKQQIAIQRMSDKYSPRWYAIAARHEYYKSINGRSYEGSDPQNFVESLEASEASIRYARLAHPQKSAVMCAYRVRNLELVIEGCGAQGFIEYHASGNVLLKETAKLVEVTHTSGLVQARIPLLIMKVGLPTPSRLSRGCIPDDPCVQGDEEETYRAWKLVMDMPPPSVEDAEKNKSDVLRADILVRCAKWARGAKESRFKDMATGFMVEAVRIYRRSSDVYGYPCLSFVVQLIVIQNYSASY